MKQLATISMLASNHKEVGVKSVKMLTQVTKIHQPVNSFEDFYEDLSRDWQLKAERLQNRRWHKIRQASR